MSLLLSSRICCLPAFPYTKRLGLKAPAPSLALPCLLPTRRTFCRASSQTEQNTSTKSVAPERLLRKLHARESAPRQEQFFLKKQEAVLTRQQKCYKFPVTSTNETNRLLFLLVLLLLLLLLLAFTTFAIISNNYERGAFFKSLKDCRKLPKK
jgi:hypothetical protein